MHSHKAKPDKINDKHGSSLPSINECFGLLCYTFRQKALLHRDILPLLAWNFLTETAMKYMPRDGNSFLTGMVSEPDRVFSLSLAVSIQRFQT